MNPLKIHLKIGNRCMNVSQNYVLQFTNLEKRFLLSKKVKIAMPTLSGNFLWDSFCAQKTFTLFLTRTQNPCLHSGVD